LFVGAVLASATAGAQDIDWQKVDATLGRKANVTADVHRYGFPRSDLTVTLDGVSIKISEDGMAITPPGPMGVATGINFQPTGGGKAAITGDFVLAGNEVNPVIKALRDNGIEVTALHSHMLAEEPRLFFMHFWANDDAVKLAKGLHAALEKMAIAK